MHRLLLTASGRAFEGLSKQDLLWRPFGQPSSVDTTLGPRLEGLGAVPPLNIDFVRLAALVFFCDRTVSRPPMLRREFDLEVAVSDPARWAPYSDRLSALLNLLTGDRWSLAWKRRREPALGSCSDLPDHDACLLFSGGADSVCGALTAKDEERHVMLVSHSDSGGITGQQNAALSALAAVLGEEPEQIRWRLARTSRQIGSNGKFGDEPSRRSRSLLFIALGAAVHAAGSGESLWIAENGFTSLNPPLMPESGGALSTRTTHPALLLGLTEVLGDIGVGVSIRNVFSEQTKGEMFAGASNILGAKQSATLLSATHSCGKSPQGLKNIPPSIHCGLCFGCLVRRGAFKAAALEDETRYATQELSASRRNEWLSRFPDRITTYNALQSRLEIGFGEDDVLDLGLPDDADLDGALDLMQRGLAELEAVEIA